MTPTETGEESGPEHGPEPRIGRSVSLDHAAEILGVSRRTVYNRIREGRLQTVRTIGGSQRVLVDSVQKILTEFMPLSQRTEGLASRRPA
jgi:excisionase family DNA binding protein